MISDTQSYKTILMHVDAERNLEGLLAYAAPLAEANGAHLVGLALLPSFLKVPIAKAGTTALIDEIRDAFAIDAARMKSKFEAKPGSIGNASREWRLADPGFKGATEIIAEHASAADLVIARQDDPSGPGAGLTDLAGLLAITAARPVLILPHTQNPIAAPASILVALDGSRTATRAVFDALPLLRAARKVVLATIRSANARERSNLEQHDRGGRDICDALLRHGIDCTLAVEPPLETGIGPTLVSLVEHYAVDVLVMGAYGHSRTREIVFGGATRFILRHMTTPVMLSH